MEDLERIKSVFHGDTKQVMLYYKFGSSLKKKNSNYFLSFKAETILELFLRENFPNNRNSMFSKGIDWELIKRYQIQNIFWNKDADSETSKFRKMWWDELLKRRTNLILKSRKSQTSIKIQTLDKLKTEIGPDLAVSFIDLAILNEDNNFIDNFQIKNKLLNAQPLKVFQFSHLPSIQFFRFRKTSS
jgi:hypothetical protein